jgi:Domain of unknown function (DUF4124)
MRQVATLLLCGVALAAGAAEVWRWKDANGVVHYSDNPQPGAERVAVNAPASAGEAAAPDSGSDYANDTASEGASSNAQAVQPVRYASCTVNQPSHDQVFQGLQPVGVELRIEPGLQEGHQVRVLYDGAALAEWPADSTSFTLNEVYRGSHTLAVRIVDANGRNVCAGSTVTFHLRQQSVLGR